MRRADEQPVEPIWNDRQLGLVDGTSPTTLHDGQPAIVDAGAVDVARSRFNDLLGPVKSSQAIELPIVAEDKAKVANLKVNTGAKG